MQRVNETLSHTQGLFGRLIPPSPPLIPTCRPGSSGSGTRQQPDDCDSSSDSCEASCCSSGCGGGGGGPCRQGACGHGVCRLGEAMVRPLGTPHAPHAPPQLSSLGSGACGVGMGLGAVSPRPCRVDVPPDQPPQPPNRRSMASALPSFEQRSPRSCPTGTR